MSGRILLVDDDSDIRKTLGELLENSGYDVDGAANGREALDKLHRDPQPCVILLDLMMPVMDGYEFRARQTQEPRLNDIPVVVITAGAVVRTDELSGAQVLGKPIQLDRLMEAIGRHCQGNGTVHQRL